MTLGLAAAAASPASAQQLWNIEEVTARPVPPIVMEGVAMSAAAGGALTAETATVQVAFDYLRLGMGHLELPLPDGSVIEAVNAVFENRGGNLMWTGEVPGAGYESVLFTLQDGHLVGWFGEPGGPKYVVHAGPDGRGSLAVEAGPTGDWCGVEAGSGPAQRRGGTGPVPDRDLARAAAGSPRPAAAASQSNGSRLDILTIYPGSTEAYWRVIGGPAVGIQQLADYLNMVFRNSAIQATANLIPVRWDPKVIDDPRTQGGHHHDGSGWWQTEFVVSTEITSLTRLHQPDLIHFIPAKGTGRAGGRSELRWSLDPVVLTGWSRPSPGVFAHEIGHNLGGDHEPTEIGSWAGDFAEYQSTAFRPWMFGHTDMTSCARREGRGDLLYCPHTIMSYGLDASNEPGHVPSQEPFYSSVRHQPNGWTIGVAGTSEVERVFDETVPVAVQSGEEAPWSPEQVPRSVTGVHWTGHDTVRVDWSEDWRSDEDDGQLTLALAEGAHDVYSWYWDWGGSSPVLQPPSAPNLAPVIRSDGSQVGVEVSGLRPGGRYRITVRKLPGQGKAPWTGEETWPLTNASDVFHLKPRAHVSGSPSAASNLGASVTGPDSIRLHWRDNSCAETGYEVWYRKWSGKEPDKVWRRHGAPLPAGTRHVDVDGLAAEEIVLTSGSYSESQIGRYSFVVVAYNDQGWNASETFEMEFMPGPHPAPTASGEITDCTLRRTGIDLDGSQVWACLETPDGQRRRMWDYQLDSDESGRLYFFDRDNAEILVKMLDGCAINGHRWVFVAPVTTLSFRLMIEEPGPYIANRRRLWHYDSERRPQDRIPDHELVGNPKDRTARTVSDTTAFPCTTAEIQAAKATAASLDVGTGVAGLLPVLGRSQPEGPQ